jgi:predicted lipoprotein with Yx(FWY)xxD motif
LIAPATTQAAGTTVSLGTASGIGKVLVTGKGVTLYLFEKDKKGGGKSTCAGSCAKFWPPLITKGKPVARGGVKSSLLGTIKRSDGTSQATYAGWPLYTYTGDSRPGQANGTGLTAFGGTWFPLHSTGKKAG